MNEHPSGDGAKKAESEFDNQGIVEKAAEGISRRRFLKMMGAGIGSAVLAGGGISVLKSESMTGLATSSNPCGTSDSGGISDLGGTAGSAAGGSYKGKTVSGKWWVTGNPTGGFAADLGGGPYYENKVQPDNPNIVQKVSSASELQQAINNASSGDIVWVNSDSTITTSDGPIRVGGGVTIASGRGINSSRGALIKGPRAGLSRIKVTGDARISGLRIEGPWPDTQELPLSTADFAGINARPSNGSLEVDNCEIYGVSWGGVVTKNTAANVHHCDIHHSMKDGMGYGGCRRKLHGFNVFNQLVSARC